MSGPSRRWWIGWRGPAYASEFCKLTETERARAVAVAVAVETNDGRSPLVAQANHGSSRIASELARTYEGMGANLISFALPGRSSASCWR